MTVNATEWGSSLTLGEPQSRAIAVLLFYTFGLLFFSSWSHHHWHGWYKDVVDSHWMVRGFWWHTIKRVMWVTAYGLGFFYFWINEYCFDLNWWYAVFAMLSVSGFAYMAWYWAMFKTNVNNNTPNHIGLGIAMTMALVGLVLTGVSMIMTGIVSGKHGNHATILTAVLLMAYQVCEWLWVMASTIITISHVRNHPEYHYGDPGRPYAPVAGRAVRGCGKPHMRGRAQV